MTVRYPHHCLYSGGINGPNQGMGMVAAKLILGDKIIKFYLRSLISQCRKKVFSVLARIPSRNAGRTLNLSLGVDFQGISASPTPLFF